MALIDRFGRCIDYLRISTTDHCSLKCGYCMLVFSGRPYLDQVEILTYAEFFSMLSSVIIN